MLKAVSWKAFLIALVILVIVYYLIVLLKYFRSEIKSFLSGKARQHKAKEKPENKFKEHTITETSWDELEMVVHDLRYGVMERFGAGADKDILLNALKQRLISYQGLRKAAFRVAINNYIVTNAKEINGVTFSVGELDDAWDNVSR